MHGGVRERGREAAGGTGAMTYTDIFAAIHRMGIRGRVSITEMGPRNILVEISDEELKPASESVLKQVRALLRHIVPSRYLTQVIGWRTDAERLGLPVLPGPIKVACTTCSRENDSGAKCCWWCGSTEYHK
jgi:hypothetical protein